MVVKSFKWELDFDGELGFNKELSFAEKSIKVLKRVLSHVHVLSREDTSWGNTVLDHTDDEYTEEIPSKGSLETKKPTNKDSVNDVLGDNSLNQHSKRELARSGMEISDVEMSEEDINEDDMSGLEDISELDVLDYLEDMSDLEDFSEEEMSDDDRN